MVTGIAEDAGRVRKFHRSDRRTTLPRVFVHARHCHVPATWVESTNAPAPARCRLESVQLPLPSITYILKNQNARKQKGAGEGIEFSGLQNKTENLKHNGKRK